MQRRYISGDAPARGEAAPFANGGLAPSTQRVGATLGQESLAADATPPRMEKNGPVFLQIIKKPALTLLKATGAMTAARWLSRRRVRILAYHGADDYDDPVLNFDGLQVSPTQFRRQLDLIARHYHVAPLRDVLQAFAEGQAPGPATVCLTFDDGYRNNRTVAAPVLREFGFAATFFVATGFLDGRSEPWWYRFRQAVRTARGTAGTTPAGARVSIASVRDKVRFVRCWEDYLKSLPATRRNQLLSVLMEELQPSDVRLPYPMMAWEDVRALREMGFEIGAHTVSHAALSREAWEAVETEVRESVQRLREAAGVAPAAFSYPFGGLQDAGRLKDLLAGLGVLGAVTTDLGLNGPSADRYFLRRLNVGRHGPLEFEAMLSGL